MQDKISQPVLGKTSMVIGGILYVPDGKGGMVEMGPDPMTSQTRINLERAALIISGLAFSQAEIDCKDCD